MNKWLFVSIGLILVAIPPVLGSLLLMPIVPGMQDWQSTGISYTIYSLRWEMYVIGAALALWGIIQVFKYSRLPAKIVVTLLSCVVILALYLSATEMSAEVMFAKPEQSGFITTNASDTTRCIIVNQNDESKAYPIDLLAHHHFIVDTVGGTPVLVTYCTMCHTGRVFSPIIDGKVHQFRLVGANHFNAMLEDESGSWWYQATGECMQGNHVGKILTELPFEEMSIASFMKLGVYTLPTKWAIGTHDSTKAKWAKGYSTRIDTTTSLTRKSRVFGVTYNAVSYAFPHYLVKNHEYTQYTIDCNGKPLKVTVLPGPTLVAQADQNRVQVYDEYWHSWNYFHPATRIWVGS